MPVKWCRKVTNRLQKYFKNDVFCDNSINSLMSYLQQTKKLIKILISFIAIKKEEKSKNEAIEKCFEHIWWYLISAFITSLQDLNNPNTSTP